jgi:hypothetical protein
MAKRIPKEESAAPQDAPELVAPEPQAGEKAVVETPAGSLDDRIAELKAAYIDAMPLLKVWHAMAWGGQTKVQRARFLNAVDALCKD